MTVNYETDLLAKTAVELRKIGAQLGIPGASKGRKQDLVVSIALAYERERQEREAREATMATLDKIHSSKKAKRCADCKVRPVTKDSPESLLCKPCLAKAEWENTHSDYGHDRDADGNPTGDYAEECWICHPELDRTSDSYQPRSGTSRQGMKMNVKRGQTAEQKAEATAKALKGFNTKISQEKGQIILAGDDGGTLTFELFWNARGQYLYGPSTITVNGKTRKVRNVSELLRTLG